MKSKPKETTKPNTPEQIMEQLHADLKHWQRELRLEDFDIEIRWMARGEEHEKLGKCYDYSLSQLFIIAVEHPDRRAMMENVRPFNGDFEVILVHELLHSRDIRWRGFSEIQSLLNENETLNELYEISLDAVAEALVRARRRITR
jgi:recombinational DNA repair protein RecR